MVARPWSSSRHSCGERLPLRCDGTLGILSRTRRERIPPLDLGGGNGASLDVGGTLVLPLEWRRVCRVTSMEALHLMSEKLEEVLNLLCDCNSLLVGGGWLRI